MRAASAVLDGGVVVVGEFNGTWNGVISEGGADFAAVKLDSEGAVTWRWQVKQPETITRTCHAHECRAYTICSCWQDKSLSLPCLVETIRIHGIA